MANLYVRSTDGNNADNGSTWALAKADLAGAMAIDAAGDVTYVSQAHAESTVASVTFNCAGSLAVPSRIICGNDGAEPPTALATSATITSNITGGALTLNGSVYVYGVTFVAGTSTGSPAVVCCGTGNHVQVFDNCSFQLAGTGAAGVIRPIGAGVTGCKTIWRNCSVKFAAAGQGIQLNGRWQWNGGSVLAGGTSPTVLISAINVGAATSSGVFGEIENVDLSNCSATLNLVSNAANGAVLVRFRNCKLPSTWTGTIFNGALAGPARAELINCDNGSTNYKIRIEDYVGTLTQETVIVRTGGASDGTTPIAWKMVSTANASYPTQPFASEYINIRCNTPGIARTVTAEIIHDSATNLKNDEAWLEVDYLGTSGQSMGVWTSDAPANILTASADQTTSAATWVTTGLANPNTQKLDVTITPQKAGYFRCRVMLAKASKTIYVCPKIVLT